MENNYQNIITLKFAQAEQPKFEERRGKGYIEFGVNNDYPSYLLDLYKGSPKHGAIVKGKATYVYGKGFAGVDVKANSKGETWNQVFKKCVLDDAVFSGYYLQIVWNKLGKVKDIYHIKFQKVRTNKEESKFWVKDDWKDNREKAREYTVFTGVYDKDHPAQILFVKQYNPEFDIYPLPDYFQALNYIESDIQISRHILGNAKDGFVAGKMIQFFNGEPVEEQKGDLEKGLKKKLTGSEGDRVVIVFSKSGEQPVQISDLGNTMLTKEDFTHVNLLVQQEIFAGHQITSPMLFGVKTEGQLGGRTEIRDAYEIFNNTYVNERQQAHEETFNHLFKLIGLNGDYKIIPVEPLGFELTEASLLKVLPREYFLEQMSVDQKYYPLQPVEGELPSAAPVAPSGQVNSNLAGMTGRQFQNLERIIRKYKKGALTREQAAMMLKQSFGLGDEDVCLMLDEQQQFSEHEEVEFALVNAFNECGDNLEDYEVLDEQPARLEQHFADVKELNQLEANVLNLVRKDKRITAATIAEQLKIKESIVARVMTGLEEAGVLKSTVTKVGKDEIIERTSTDVKIKSPKPATLEILLRYSYGWRSEVPVNERNSAAHPSRDFCVKMMEISKTKVWSRADIERISERLGYSVWDRVGGWWTMPNGEHSPQCRHEWKSLRLIKKKQ